MLNLPATCRAAMMPASKGSSSPQDKLQRLRALSEQLLERRRLIIASNRGPMEYSIEADGALVANRGSGGMVTALMSAARFVPATWVASAMTDGDRLAAERAGGALLQVPDNEIYVRFVTVPQSTYQRHYYVLCNPLLWFVQHFMWNTPRTPNIGRAVYEAWESGYIPVNEAIADAVIHEAKQQSAPPYVLLQDIWWCRLLLSLVDHRVRYGFVDGNVAAFPGLVNSPADVGRSRRVPHEMLHEPQQRIAEDVIVALVCGLWDGQEADIDFVVRHLEE